MAAMPEHTIKLDNVVSVASLIILSTSSAMALYRSNWRQSWETTFVASSYANILLLFGCLQKLEKVRPDNLKGRRRLQATILILAIILNFSFCHQVPKLMPLPTSAVVWCLAVLVATGGMWLFASIRVD